jgi:hypothetical protein
VEFSSDRSKYDKYTAAVLERHINRFFDEEA